IYQYRQRHRYIRIAGDAAAYTVLGDQTADRYAAVVPLCAGLAARRGCRGRGGGAVRLRRFRVSRTRREVSALEDVGRAHLAGERGVGGSGAGRGRGWGRGGRVLWLVAAQCYVTFHCWRQPALRWCLT